MTQWLLKRFVPGFDRSGDPAVRERYGLLSGAVGIVLNLLLSGGKFLAGAVTGSISIMADAFNNLSDAGSSVVTLVGFRLAGQKADRDHPFGHGRIEYLAGLLVSLLILMVGVELIQSSVEKILHPAPVELSALSVVILAVSVAVKLWMSYFNRTLSRRIHSAAMAATATDSLSDAVGHRHSAGRPGGGILARAAPGRLAGPGGSGVYPPGGLGGGQGHGGPPSG